MQKAAQRESTMAHLKAERLAVAKVDVWAQSLVDLKAELTADLLVWRWADPWAE